MSNENLVHLGYKPEIVGKKELQQSWSDILDWLKEKASDVWKATGDELGVALGDGITAAGKSYDELEKSFKTTTTNALKGYIGPLFKGEMDEVEDICGKAWASMEVTFDKQMNSLMNTLTGRALEVPYNIFKQSLFDPEELLKKYIADPLKDMASDAGDWVVTALKRVLFMTIKGINKMTVIDINCNSYYYRYGYIRRAACRRGFRRKIAVSRINTRPADGHHRPVLYCAAA